MFSNRIGFLGVLEGKVTKPVAACGFLLLLWVMAENAMLVIVLA